MSLVAQYQQKQKEVLVMHSCRTLQTLFVQIEQTREAQKMKLLNFLPTQVRSLMFCSVVESLLCVVDLQTVWS